MKTSVFNRSSKCGCVHRGCRVEVYIEEWRRVASHKVGLKESKERDRAS